MAPTISYPNLISNSALISETISLLEAAGGRASAVEVVDAVMKISRIEPQLAKRLVADLTAGDPRLSVTEDADVELVELDFGAGNLREADFVVFDLETTGAKLPPSRVTEIGAYKIQNGRITGEFHSLVDPEISVPAFITELTGIDDAMLKGAPKFAELAHSFLDFIGGAVLVAHNAMFDMRFINHEIGMVFEGYRLANPYLCTVQLSRKLLPNLENHRLHTVAANYGITIENRHRAAGDAHATAKIFIEFLLRLHEKGIANVATACGFKG
jgi:DNA polymerase III epsilon subunit family exonuclease